MGTLELRNTGFHEKETKNNYTKPVLPERLRMTFRIKSIGHIEMYPCFPTIGGSIVHQWQNSNLKIPSISVHSNKNRNYSPSHYLCKYIHRFVISVFLNAGTPMAGDIGRDRSRSRYDSAKLAVTDPEKSSVSKPERV